MAQALDIVVPVLDQYVLDVLGAYELHQSLRPDLGAGNVTILLPQIEPEVKWSFGAQSTDASD